MKGVKDSLATQRKPWAAKDCPTSHSTEYDTCTTTLRMYKEGRGWSHKNIFWMDAGQSVVKKFSNSHDRDSVEFDFNAHLVFYAHLHSFLA